MANLTLCWPNWANANCTLDNGSWSLTPSNMLTPNYWEVARTSDAENASTVFDIDLGQVRNILALALVRHNLSADATWQITAGTTVGGSDIYDSDVQAVWHLPFDNNLMNFEDMSLWEGTIDQDYDSFPYLCVHSLLTWYNARYLRVRIFDDTNTDSFIQIGKLFVGGGFQPRINAAYGLKDSWEDKTEILESSAGTVLANQKRRYRMTSFVLENLSTSEAAIVYEMQRRQGLFGDILYLPDTEDQDACQRYGFVGRLAEMSQIDYPYPRVRSVPIVMKEK